MNYLGKSLYLQMKNEKQLMIIYPCKYMALQDRILYHKTECKGNFKGSRLLQCFPMNIFKRKLPRTSL